MKVFTILKQKIGRSGIPAFIAVICGMAAIFSSATAQTDNVGIGTTTPDNSAILELSSTSKGFLVPRMTTAQRDAIASPASGLILFNTTASEFQYYNGTSWVAMVSSGSTAFNQITTGTNTAATMTVGTGASLLTSGTGYIQANRFAGTGSTSDAVDLATGEVNGILGIANGGTNASTFTQNQFLWYNGTSLVASGFANTDFATAAHTHAQLHDRSHSMTSTADHTATAWRLFYSNGTGQVTELSLGTNGQVLQSTGTAAAPTWASMTGSLPSGTNGQTVRHDGTGWVVSSLLYNNGTNIGINTTSPAYMLDVNGAVRSGQNGTSGQVRIYSEQGTTDYEVIFNPSAAMTQNTTYTLPANDGNSGEVLTTNGTGTLSWTAVSGGSLPAGTSGQTLRHDGTNWTASSLLFNDGTNVGINTATPGYMLDVNGAMRSGQNGTSGQLRLYSEQGATDYEVIFNPSATMTQNTTYTMPDNDGNTGDVLTTNGTGTLSWTAPGAGSLPAGTSGQTLRHDGSTWVANDNIFNDGSSVGIGTATPLTNFHIYESNADTDPALLIQQAGTGNASQRYYLNSGQNISMGIDNGDNDNFKIRNTATLGGTAYNDATTMMKIHTESGHEGIVDFNHQSRARAYRNATQSISNNTWTVVQFNSISPDFNEQSDFNTSTNRFIAPVAGYYQVNSRIEFDFSTTAAAQSYAYCSVAIYVNGTAWSYGNELAWGINSTSLSARKNDAPMVSDIVYLDAGDYVQIYCFQNLSGNKNLVAGATRTYVSIHKLS